MPISTIGNKQDAPSGKGGCYGSSGECFHFGKKILMTIVGILLVNFIFYFGILIRNNAKKYNFIGRADKQERTITVNGLGKVSGNNDIAMTTIGYSNTDKDVAKAQADNKKVMDQVFADLKKLGLWDDVMVNDLKYYNGSVAKISRIPEILKQRYATAFEIDPTWLVEAASRRQKWIDQAQSLNL